MRLFICLLLALTTAIPAIAGDSAAACPVTSDDLMVKGHHQVSSMGDGAGFQQLVYGGQNSAFSITDFLIRDRAGVDRERVIESVAQQLVKQTDDGTVQQVNPNRVTALGLDLVALLYIAKADDDITRIEAGGVIHRDGCYSVLRYSQAGPADRKAMLDRYLALIRSWHQHAGAAQGS